MVYPMSEVQHGQGGIAEVAGDWASQKALWLERMLGYEQVFTGHMRPHTMILEQIDPRLRMAKMLRCMRAIHSIKSLHLCRWLRRAVEEEDFLGFASAGRFLIEQCAAFVYFGGGKMAPLLAQWNGVEEPDPAAVAELCDVMDRFLTGTRYDWAPVFRGHVPEQALPRESKSQINILTCVQKWEKLEPGVENFYGIFCDMVHPNVGSMIVLLQHEAGRFSVGGSGGDPLGRIVVNRTMERLLEMLEVLSKVLSRLEAEDRRITQYLESRGMQIS